MHVWQSWTPNLEPPNSVHVHKTEVVAAPCLQLAFSKGCARGSTYSLSASYLTTTLVTQISAGGGSRVFMMDDHREISLLEESMRSCRGSCKRLADRWYSCCFIGLCWSRLAEARREIDGLWVGVHRDKTQNMKRSPPLSTCARTPGWSPVGRVCGGGGVEGGRNPLFRGIKNANYEKPLPRICWDQSVIDVLE